ncbi:aminotransferase class V-fold PLP-dependent enzyme [Candidatus Methylacidiphilum infernorum]|uniref:cysteine desulfurase n=1 Tax=Candidatus Methylacidiphilum infernorum TaxID=511746 RepID=A0ABX7PVM2_9BACT|nr:aminotransferase class V-fold PLP-dependent enzyme [Candidatus Methylacidiphilum infernorum]QSR86701.1 aminotransferase class V-fold PLP-dependent enzyme [Candidatus Methylacidiphilum infernorum]
MRLIYLDNNATTPVDPLVLKEMVPFFSVYYGNPSSPYRLGQEAKQHLKKARIAICRFLNCEEDEIVFTSCGTESNNAAILSALRTTGKKRIVTTVTEHSSIQELCTDLEKRGFDIDRIPVDSLGLIDLEEVEKRINEQTALVSVMWANNETGVIFPVEQIAEICRKRGVYFHTDAVQAVGKIPIDLSKIPVDFLSLTGHKFYAPKGIGVLFVRKGRPFEPFIRGGSQEMRRRAGTENVPAIVGMGKAIEILSHQMVEENKKIRALRDLLETRILSEVPLTKLNGDKLNRIPNTTNICFKGVDAETLLFDLDQKGICASGGSACTTGSLKPSRVLTAMGLNPLEAKSSVRFSLGRHNTEEEIQFAADEIVKSVEKIRGKIPRH